MVNKIQGGLEPMINYKRCLAISYAALYIVLFSLTVIILFIKLICCFSNIYPAQGF